MNQQNWTTKENKRKSSNNWAEKLHPQIMERISNYEQYLKKWGITAQTGIEQEFRINSEKNLISNNTPLNIDFVPELFTDSPFVEKMSGAHWQIPSFGNQYSIRDNGYEISIGTGNGEGKKNHPHPSLEPTIMVKATENLNKLISTEANKPENKYGANGITFDPTEHGRRLYSQQINISLWNKNKEPLFKNSIQTQPNELSSICIKNLLQAQNSLIALLTINPNAFIRFKETSNKFYNGKMKNISFADKKQDNPSILLRKSPNSSSNYIENRLGNSDMPPSVNMLITLAGVAKGVEEYVKTYNIQSPEQLHEHVANNYSYNNTGNNKLSSYALPETQKEALKTTENSQLAKEILGGELHENFINNYKKECLQNTMPSI